MTHEQELMGWWENDLDDDERTQLMDGYIWNGTTEDRHIKLREMRKIWEIQQVEEMRGDAQFEAERGN